MSDWKRHARRLAFLLVLWAFATLYLGGDIGKWHDDYFFQNQFVAETGEVRSWTLDKPMHFWRPLYRLLATPLIVALWERDAALHVVTALVHLLTAGLVYRLLRGLGARAGAAGAVGLLFLVCPVAYEVVFWNTVMFTGLATAGLVGVFMVYLWYLRRVWPRNPSLCSGLVEAGVVSAVIGVMTFAIAGMNEQPAAGVLGLPVLAVAEWRRARRAGPCTRTDDATEGPRQIGTVGARCPWHPLPTWSAVIRAGLPCVAAAAALVVYVSVHRADHPGRWDDRIGARVKPSYMVQRVQDLASDVEEGLVMRRFASGAWRMGVRTLGERPWTSAAWAVALAGTGAWWLVGKRRREGGERESGSESRPTTARIGSESRSTPPVLVALFGLAVFIAPWIPIAQVIYPASPRLFYAPLVGLAVMAGALLEGLMRRRVFAGAAWKVAGLVLLMSAMGAMAVMMVGIQGAYRARWRADEDQAAQLVALFQGCATGTILLPVRVADRPVSTGAARFDGAFIAPLRTGWSAGWYIQRTLRRSDMAVSLAGDPDGTPAIVLLKQEEGWLVQRKVRGMAAPFEGQRRRLNVALERVIPFEIDEDGRVRVVTGMALDGEVIRLPRVEEMRRGREIEELVVEVGR